MTGLPGQDGRPGIFGPGAVDELPRIIRELGVSRLLLVTGRNSFHASGAARILPELTRIAAVETWSDFSPNPEVDDVVAGTRIARRFRPDGVLAIGGGSVLDMAKLVAAFRDREPEEIPDAIRTSSVRERSGPLILVPTTSGSGSEATHFAVAYIGEDKFSVAHRVLLPDYVVLDPALTTSAGRYQKATSVIDAIAQAVESHWARGATPASRTFARAALAELVPSAGGFLDGDEAATLGAARGSHLAGRAIDLSKTTGAHALAYGLTRRHGISHGHAVATTLGAFARRHVEEASSPHAADHLAGDLESVAGLVGADDVAHLGDRLDGIATDLGLELRLGALGVPRPDLARMAGAVNHERLANNPVELSEPELTDLLDSCW